MSDKDDNRARRRLSEVKAIIDAMEGTGEFGSGKEDPLADDVLLEHDDDEGWIAATTGGVYLTLYQCRSDLTDAKRQVRTFYVPQKQIEFLKRAITRFEARS